MQHAVHYMMHGNNCPLPLTDAARLPLQQLVSHTCCRANAAASGIPTSSSASATCCTGSQGGSGDLKRIAAMANSILSAGSEGSWLSAMAMFVSTFTMLLCCIACNNRWCARPRQYRGENLTRITDWTSAEVQSSRQASLPTSPGLSLLAMIAGVQAANLGFCGAAELRLGPAHRQ